MEENTCKPAAPAARETDSPACCTPAPTEVGPCCGGSSAEEAPGAGCCCAMSGRTRRRTPEEYQSLLNRLSRIEGQVRGLRGMLEKDAYCPDILFQASAVSKALDSFSKELLAQHIRTCVVDDLEAGKYETVDELVRVIQRLMK